MPMQPAFRRMQREPHRPAQGSSRRLTLAIACWLAAGCLAASAAAAQAPVVEKVDPPNWWAGHSINPVRLLIRGRNLAGASLDCPRLSCSAPRVNASGSYAFVEVTISPRL